jgi:hypothetical protein
VNKFDALKMFQGWPPEWQRLCAEYWIETGEIEPTKVSTFGERLSVPATVSDVAQVWCHADQVDLAKKLLEPVATLAHESVSTRLAQDKAAKVAAKASVGYTHSGYPVQLWEKDAIDGMIHQQLNDTAIAKAMELGWPFRRTKRAWEQLAYGRRKLASGKGGCK